ncbi:MAG: hypothetical protein MUC68_17640 [Burkholderiaceae bacterium]|jgi:hypothetical protein|nr:hypothetical protein [Burkholderiaceae bacterium]
MAWQRVATDPLDIDTGVAPARARAIAEALVRRAVPILARRDGRAEPLASGALFVLGPHVVLVTCRHIFDDAAGGVALGDLGVPRTHSAGVLWLARTASRVISHPQRDLVLIELAPGRVREELLQHWPPVPLAVDDWVRPAGGAPASLYALAGWPYAQMRRVDETVYARPVVFFAAPAAARVWDGVPAQALDDMPDADGGPPSLRVRYARVARRCDGVEVHSPELDGVSGAMLWAVHDSADPRDDMLCVLRPAAVQYAFKHGAYARAEPLALAGALLDRVMRR